MLTASMDLSGFHRLRNETLAKLSTGTADAVREGLSAGAEHARNNHPHQKQTGRLTGSELYSTVDSADSHGAMGSLRNDTPYAGFVEYGTQPHRIEATNASALVFEWKGGTVFFKFVNHPGTQPLAFMHPAARYAIELIRQRLEHSTIPLIVQLWK